MYARASSLSFAHPQDLMRSRSSHGTKQHKSGDSPRTELSEGTPNYEVATFENRSLLFRSAGKVQMSPRPMAHVRAPQEHLPVIGPDCIPLAHMSQGHTTQNLSKLSASSINILEQKLQHSFCRMRSILSAFRAMAPRSQHRATARQKTSG